MSIWSPSAEIGYDFDSYVDHHGRVRAYPEGFSNAYPHEGPVVMSPAAIGMASICSWCVPGHRDNGEDFETIGPWLRLEVASPKAPNYWVKNGDEPTYEDLGVSVVMDERAVRSLRDALTDWLERPKVHPIDESPP